MHEIEKLEQELRQTTARIVELTTESRALAANVETAQTAFIAGEITLDEFSAGKTYRDREKLGVLQSTIDLLLEKEQGLNIALSQEREAERRRRIASDMVTTANRARSLWETYVDLRSELNDLLKEKVTLMIRIEQELVGEQRSFHRQQQSAVPGHLLTAEEKDRVRRSLNDDLTAAGLTPEAYRIAATSAHHLLPPEIEFHEAVFRAEDVLRHRIFVQRRAQADTRLGAHGKVRDTGGQK